MGCGGWRGGGECWWVRVGGGVVENNFSIFLWSNPHI